MQPELMRMPAVKDSAMLAWNTEKTKQMGLDRVHKTKAWRRHRREGAKLHNSESVEALARG